MIKAINKQFFYLFLFIGVATLASSCSDSTTTAEDTGTVQVQSELSSQQVTIVPVTLEKSNSRALASGATVDSLHITSAKFLLSEIKLQQKGPGTEIKVKTGPAILSVDQQGAKLVTSSPVPVATYNKFNFKFHRLNDQEVQPWLAVPDFADFATNDRATVILEGVVFKNGQSTPFTYSGKVEEDLHFDLDDVAITTGGTTVIVVRLNTSEVFKDKDSGKVLDPRDPDNANKIDSEIKAAIKAVRK